MKNIQSWRQKINPIIGKIQNSAFVKTITAGMMVSMPATMAGSFATILLSIQVGGFQDFLVNTGIRAILDTIILVTINVFALYVVFGIAYHYASAKKQSGAMAGVTALASFLAITPFISEVNEFGTVNYSLPIDWLSAQGIFSAMIVGFVVAILFVFIKEKGWTIKLPKSVPPVISSSFESIIPGLIILSLFGTISHLFTLTTFGSFHQAVLSLLQTPLQNIGGSIWAIMLIAFISQILWVLGIHGPMVVLSIAAMAWRPLDLENLQAFTAGAAELPNITGMSFYMVYSFAGWGMGLAVCMLSLIHI
ncbi:hypothetical protein A5868_001359 [Enterococcus sp. 12F9_DIV0723]|uniref:PTS transporter subunit EIIC n=2 Tax=unclassified Enterococcus TaxID=2608891 RepID=UPI000B3EDE6D|nr:PTS transporter subunit EIIC [Enterococcus sp. 12F9_DIV0723]OUZ16438.1 hypothetical protein A5868_001359 [Enterococcus sp. 12F9_DIV0723]